MLFYLDEKQKNTDYNYTFSPVVINSQIILITQSEC